VGKRQRFRIRCPLCTWDTGVLVAPADQGRLMRRLSDHSYDAHGRGCMANAEGPPPEFRFEVEYL
jgi:hypothetical protein